MTNPNLPVEWADLLSALRGLLDVLANGRDPGTYIRQVERQAGQARAIIHVLLNTPTTPESATQIARDALEGK
jgi:hypothetical protein